MDVLFLCGYFEEEVESEIGSKTKTWVENAANTFQKRLIAGFEAQDVNLTVVSAPFIGAWPTAYVDKSFKGFQEEENASGKVEYVHFNNIWGYRNISRTKSVKKAVDRFMKKSQAKKKAVVVYSPHTPLLEGAIYAKKLDPSVHVCLIVPDLPQYMNLSKKAHPIYDFFKKLDIKHFMELNQQVDSYMLLTKYMAEPMQVGNRPFIVVEGVTDDVCEMPAGHQRGKKIAYAGKLNETFGAKNLVEAFELIEDEDARLEICGGGELKEYVQEMCQKDKRIHYHGVVPARQAAELLQSSDVLVNPRQNNDEYTKYSFPSKNVEYLMTGNAVVAYMLDGMPESYRTLVNSPVDNTVEALADVIKRMLQATDEELKAQASAAVQYVSKERSARHVGEMLVELINEKVNEK